MDKKEPSIIGIPKSDWWPVTLFVLLSGALFVVCQRYLPSPLEELVIAWFCVGQGMLVKYNAIAKPYPKSIFGSLLSFGMAGIWPYYAYKKS
jgi:hypothetical protein